MSLFKKKKTIEPVVGLDIGTSSIKLVQLDLSTDPPTLINIAQVPTPTDALSNNAVAKTDLLAETLNGLFEANSLELRKVAIALPGPAVFIKKIQVPKADMITLAENIRFEAGNYIPHNIEAVRLDFHVIGERAKSQYDVLLVATKNEVIDSYLEALALAGLDTTVVDVDYFALQNAFETSYPELSQGTVALVNIGDRFTSINICKDGESLFSGDVAVGGKSVSEAISENLKLDLNDAEQLKLGKDEKDPNYAKVHETIDQTTEYLASELHRQLSFFWNATGQDDGIDKILLSGGGSLVKGLIDELSVKTGVTSEIIDSFRGISIGEGFDPGYIKELSPSMAIALGLALRFPGDKIYPEEE